MLPEQEQPAGLLDRWHIFRTHVAAGFLIRILTKGFGVSGGKNIPPAPAVWAMCHTDWLQTILAHSRKVAKIIPYSLAKEEMRTSVDGKFFQWLGAKFIYVRRGKADINAFRESVNTLIAGDNLLVFPEGTRGRGKERIVLKPAHAGFVSVAAMAARELQRPIPIVPMATTGTEYVMGDFDVSALPWSKRLRVIRQPARLIISPPYLIYAGKYSREQEDAVAQEIMLSIRGMLPSYRHGHYTGIEPHPFPQGVYSFGTEIDMPVTEVMLDDLGNLVRRNDL